MAKKRGASAVREGEREREVVASKCAASGEGVWILWRRVGGNGVDVWQEGAGRAAVARLHCVARESMEG